MEITVGISNKHIHLKKEDFKTLFGIEDMNKKVDLKQPGNFASEHLLTVKTAKNEIKNVRVLGPCRSYTQIEVSKTDAIILGINPPVRDSGDLKDSETVTLIGPNGTIETDGCIIARRHIHVTEQMKKDYDLPDFVSVKYEGERGGILNNVCVKIADEAFFEIHLDTDEANALSIKNGDTVEIIK